MSLCSENYKSLERCIKTEKTNQLSSFYYTYGDTALSMIYTEEDCTAPEMIPTPKWSPTLKWSPNRPRNDPNPEMIPKELGNGD